MKEVSYRVVVQMSIALEILTGVLGQAADEWKEKESQEEEIDVVAAIELRRQLGCSQ